jgi:transketolase
MHSFGASAPGPAAFKNFGITAEHVVSEAKSLVDASNRRPA